MGDSSGNALALNTYDEYGAPGASNTGRFQYTGQAWIAELGLYYYRARFYSPLLGRFLQTDPVGYTDDLNLYAYVGNDPLDDTDPKGEDCATPTSDSPCETVTVTGSSPQDASGIAVPLISFGEWVSGLAGSAVTTLVGFTALACNDSGHCQYNSENSNEHSSSSSSSSQSSSSSADEGVRIETRLMIRSFRPER